ncbi:MAG: acyl-CoA dehydrogenase [Saprospiraceae bacterium]|nr:acyl-CoA dehydrogenase [Saprospiraceae bacterium]
MSSQYVDLTTLKFLLYSVHDLRGVLANERYADYQQQDIDMMLNAVREFSDKELYPYFREMDEQPAHYQDGEILVHDQVLKYMRAGGEMGFLAGPFSYEHGGMQLPSMAVNASVFIQEAANNHLPGYIGLTVGAADLIVNFATEELIAAYVPKMLSGEWGGTMCLTEPQAGSSLSDIVTSATPHGDAYRLKGQKIFISAGDYRGAENIVHLVLARIEGAPKGTKGISLFVVPKNRPLANGGLTGNDVTAVADFQKMGQRGYCTTHLFFGDKDDCSGWLVGEPHQGLKYMFQMMNSARIGVGRGAAAIATAAYQASLNYARERTQGRELTSSGKKDASREQILIINHPDVRRMLLFQKVITEGSLSLILLASRYQDFAQSLPNEAEREKYRQLLEIITPVAKTYPSEMGIISVNNGVQVLGGYGFCSDYILQQYLRDIRISAIYEGTTGIQSQDLLGRKITMQNGLALRLLMEEIGKSIEACRVHSSLSPYAEKLEVKLELNRQVVQKLTGYAGEGDYQRFLSDATIFMEFFSTLLMAWIWLDIARQAQLAIVNGNTEYSSEFYESKVHAMRFYYKYELPKTTGLSEVLLNEASLTLTPEKKIFT